MPALSIIIPVFNHAGFLPSAIESSLQGTTSEVELVVIDDASTDASLSVADAFAARIPRVRVLRNEQNMGVERSLNRGLAATTGEFVLFRAADDVTLPGFLDQAIELHNAHPCAAFCLGDTRFFCTDPTQGRTQRAGFPSRPVFVAPDDWNQAFGGNELSVCSAVLRRSALDRAGGFDPELFWVSDWALLVTLAFQNGCVYLPSPACAMRLSASSYNSAGSADPDRQHRIFTRLLQHFAALDEPAFSALSRSGILDFFRTPLRRLPPTLHAGIPPRIQELLAVLDRPAPDARRRCGMPAALREFLASSGIGRTPNARIALFGAGGHTALLLEEWRNFSLPLPVLILVSAEPSAATVEGIPLARITVANAAAFDMIVLSSKSYEPELAHLARACFPDKCIVRIWT
jgi:glycosyltransferase involved in cell wall biosynthesis